MNAKRVFTLMFMSLMLLFASVSVLAYVSDRMDFGEIDFRGETVTFVAHQNIISQFEEGGLYAGRLEEAKQLFNIGDFEMLVVDWGEVGNTALSRFMAGESTYDYWKPPFAFYWGLVSRGAVYPVNEILPPDYFDNLPKIVRDRNEQVGYKGQLFNFSAVGGFGHATFVVFNRDLIDSEGLEDPYELYRNGEWTFEKVTEMARKVTRDTDGDGIVDQWGLSDTDPKNLVYAYGGAVTKVDENGQVYYSLDEPEAVAGLRQWVEWHNVDQIASGGENEFGAGKIAMAILPFYAIGNHVDWPFSHGILPYPQGPYTDKAVYLPGGSDCSLIPANSEYPLGMVALDNFLWTLEMWEEDRDNWIAGRIADRESYDILLEAFENWWPTDYYMNFIGGRWDGDLPYGKVCGDINSGISPATATAEVKDAAQAIIDEMFDQ